MSDSLKELQLDKPSPGPKFRWERVWGTLLRGQGTSYFRDVLFPSTVIATGETFQGMKVDTESDPDGNAFIVVYVTTSQACFVEFTKQKMRNIQKWAFVHSLEYLTYHVVRSGSEYLAYILPHIYIVDLESVMDKAPPSALLSADGRSNLHPLVFHIVDPNIVVPAFSKFTQDSTLRKMRSGVSELQEEYGDTGLGMRPDEQEACAALAYPKLYSADSVPVSFLELMTADEQDIVSAALDKPYRC